MTTFNKPARTTHEQVALLQSRGMVIADVAEAEFYLGQINYYRLGAYWLPFEVNHSSLSSKPGTTSQQVLNLSRFHRELRLLLLDAIERVEVAVRTRWAYELAHRHGPHAHLDSSLSKSLKTWTLNLATLMTEVDRADEVFVTHYKANYQQPELPPVWVVCEVMSLGLLSKSYTQLGPIATRTAIASHFDCDQQQFEGILEHLTYVRNVCAHHSRIWNRRLKKKLPQPRTKPAGLRQQWNFSSAFNADERLYNTLVLLLFLMDRIAPGHHWRQRLLALLRAYGGVPLADMGFPAGWEAFALWREVAV